MRSDYYGCWHDLKVEEIDQLEYKAHQKDHGQYPQDWCVYCEEEREGENL